MPRTHDSAAPRGLGAISSVNSRLKGFIFATDAQSQEYFIHRSMCRPQQLFEEVRDGDVVSFSISTAPKGLRGHDVRRASTEEIAIYRAALAGHVTDIEENRGNTAVAGERQTFVEQAIDVGDGDVAGPRQRRRPR